MARIVPSRRSNKGKMLGRIEDEARALARENPGLADAPRIVECVEERLGWDLSREATGTDENEARIAVLAYRDELA